MRRLGTLGGVVCVVASIAVAGSAFARGGGTESQAPRRVHATLPSRALAKGQPFTTRIEVVSGTTETLVLVAAVVHGKTFAFIVDTGAAQSQVTDKLAEQLKLRKIGKPVTVTGVGCTSKAQRVKIDDWSIAGHALPTLTIGSSDLQVAKGKLAGLLGSDVWSKFGSIQIDYANETMTVG
jgi:predicted aspartyl protease